ASFETGIANPLDAAIVAFGERHQLTAEGFCKIDEIPYDFQRKRLTIVVTDPNEPGRHRIITKGAFDNVLSVCTTLQRPHGDWQIDGADRARLEASYRTKGEEGCRVRAVATKRTEAKQRYEHADECDMTLVGFLLFVDPPRPDARRTIGDLAALGI